MKLAFTDPRKHQETLKSCAINATSSHAALGSQSLKGKFEALLLFPWVR